MNRREFMAFGASCAALLPQRASFAASPAARSSEPFLAIADRRYGDSLRFANAIACGGGEVVEIGSDIGTAWFGDIEPRLRYRGLRLAGITLPSDLFVVERLAGRSRSAITYTGIHDWRCPCSQHRLTGAISLVRPVSALQSTGLDWAPALADALVTERLQAHIETRHLVLELAPASDNPKYLTSWLMALA
jgi:hypothetical protein